MSRSIALFLIALVSTQSIAQEKVDYLRDVKPVLKERCGACHGALKQESDLRLDTASLIRKGGEGGPAIIVGKASDSNLIERVSATDESERMPPEGAPLTANQIELLKAWINGGAEAPKDEQPEKDPRQHWAFQPPMRASLKNDTGANPIDVLIARGHARHGLKPVPLADRRLLLRRVYLDLIGLPPTRAEINEFLSDSSGNAYERVVDRLLKSQHYGERWGRHWMDIWRYTDWFGLGKQLRYSQKHIWHWRDWIVESLNNDKGYDQMVVEMLAADEISPTDRDTLRATGFLARNYFLFNRTTWLDNTIEHTSKALLGLTMNCTKCHDHKYDPISQLDYYRMRAIFEPHQVRLDAWPGETDFEKNGLPRVFDAHPEEVTYLHVRGDAKNPDTSNAIAPGVPQVIAGDTFRIEPVSLPSEAVNPALQAFVLKDHLQKAEEAVEAARQAISKAKTQLATAEAQEQRRIDSKTPEQQSSAKSVQADKVFLHDDFSKISPEVWETGPGKWKYENGHLVQMQTGSSRAYIRTRKVHPADFEATLRFKTTGGQKWKSVGLSFDVNEGREKLIYLSAVSPGSKLQFAYKQGGAHTYPQDGKQDRPVKVNEEYELKIKVRGPLINVAINGEHSLAYQLPVKRESGKLELIAFDAAVEFHQLDVRPLSPDIQLVKATSAGSPPAKTLSVESSKAALKVAEKTMAAAILWPEAIRAAHAADLAKHQPNPENLNKLVTEAAIAARKYELARADEAVARAEEKLVNATDKGKVQVEKELKTAQANLDKAAEALKHAGEKYTPLVATLKALEGPAETEESRRKPYPKVSTGRRTALARWMTSRDNPLTARVAVNHIWLRHFGQPLVESVTDFGLRSKKPPQHELLDWLAIELVENQWSMKHVHRLIVTSQAYQRQASTLGVDEKTKVADPNNEYYWRRRPVRMESQVIRDSLLQLAGVLNPEVGGPTIDPKKEDTLYRRSIYFTHSRDDQNKFLTMFDDADILRCYRRKESIVPQQALTLANSKLALSMSRKIAEKLQTELGVSDDDEFVTAAFELILAVRPSDDELAVSCDALVETRKVLGNLSEDQRLRRARANFVHALLNHNDFITIR